MLKISATNIAVKAWMRQNIRGHVDRSTGEANTTALAEEAADHFDLYSNKSTYDIPEWVFDMAVDVANATGFGTK